MDPNLSARAAVVLDCLATLAPAAQSRTASLSIPTEWFRWLPAAAADMFNPHAHLETLAGSTPIDRAFGERLAAIDRVRPDHHSLRVGWLFLAGRTTIDGRVRRVFHPLVTMPVRVERAPALLFTQLVAAGDPELTDLVADPSVRHDLEAGIQWGGGGLGGQGIEVPPGLLAQLPRLRRWSLQVAAAAGLPAAALVAVDGSPDDHMRRDGLTIVAGVGAYATHDAGVTSRVGSLRAWPAGDLREWTAFHSMYFEPAELPAADHAAPDAVESPFLLTPAQREAVVRSRRDPVTLVSGAPGTGKSHTVVAIACDALARGERVLVAAKAEATVDALLDLLERAPGPDPVLFGADERRKALADRLAEGHLLPAAPVEVIAAEQRVHAALQRRDDCRASLVDRLNAERLAASAGDEVTAARSDAPGLFEPSTDLDVVHDLLTAAAAPDAGWWKRRKRRRARRALDTLAGSTPDTGLDVIVDALAVARAVRIGGAGQSGEGLEIGSAWYELERLDDAARDRVAEWLAADSRSSDRWNVATTPTVAALAKALRSGRAARRDQLRRLNDEKLTRALPLWVGTLPDIDDLLPLLPAVFDLVILDEASSIDQPLAAPALLRAKRAVIVGDPHQLRHVSFLSDEQTAAVLAGHGFDGELAARLDLRRNSAFDLAAGVAPVLVLDEHFRSDPHLIDFVADRIYGGRLQVATRSPRTTSRRCVDVVALDGGRDQNDVVTTEVRWVIGELKRLLARGAGSVGVVTPFRAQAEALERAVLASLTLEHLEALDLRIGTVHGFQGNERDVVIASLGLGTDAPVNSWRFVADSHLFTVLVTRARKRFVVLVSGDPPADGLLADYLREIAEPPRAPVSAGPGGPWTRAVAERLVTAGVPIVSSYPTGRHVVDICAGNEGRSVAIECEVNTGGADAHIERHLALQRSGWEFLEAYRSRWGHRRGELVVELLAALGHEQ